MMIHHSVTYVTDLQDINYLGVRKQIRFVFLTSLNGLHFHMILHDDTPCEQSVSASKCTVGQDMILHDDTSFGDLQIYATEMIWASVNKFGLFFLTSLNFFCLADTSVSEYRCLSSK